MGLGARIINSKDESTRVFKALSSFNHKLLLHIERYF